MKNQLNISDMKTRILLPAIMVAATIVAVSCKKTGGAGEDLATVTIHNATGDSIAESLVEADVGGIMENASGGFAAGLAGEPEEIRANYLELVPSDRVKAYRFIDSDRNGVLDKLQVLTSLGPGESRKLKIRKYGKPVMKMDTVRRAYAELQVKEGGAWVYKEAVTGNEQYVYEGGRWVKVDSLRVPDQHTDHSFFIKYEGPGWESEKVGYRFYLDWRNATDIFGKTRDSIVLAGVGLDGFDSYHDYSDWGMDVLNVGNSLGMASIGFWDGHMARRVAETDSIICRVPDAGDLRAMVCTDWYGWKVNETSVDLNSVLTIDAGSRLTKRSLKLGAALPNLCTGIVKHPAGELIVPDDVPEEWSYLATWGDQSMNNDGLGMAVFYRTADLIELTGDPLNHVVVLKPTADNALTYCFGAVWELDEGGITTKEAFIDYLDRTAALLSHSPEVSVE